MVLGKVGQMIVDVYRRCHVLVERDRKVDHAARRGGGIPLDAGASSRGGEPLVLVGLIFDNLGRGFELSARVVPSPRRRAGGSGDLVRGHQNQNPDDEENDPDAGEGDNHPERGEDRLPGFQPLLFEVRICGA